MLTKKYCVRLSDVGVHGVLGGQALMNILQDIAAEHAMKLGFGVNDLAGNGLAWFLGRLSVRVNRYPRWDEEITVATWPSGGKGLMCFRDFEITDSAGVVIAAASSGWLVVDLNRRRPLRPNRALGDIPVNPKRALETDFLEIDQLAECQFSKTFEPRFAEIDLNNHINNSIYLTWATESMPQEVLAEYVPAEIDIAFKSEVSLGRPVNVETCITADQAETKTAIHSICQDGSESIAARLKTVWKPAKA
ncbi:MAG: hypothetical protein K9M75_12105 [Phycisphaerae bacterium]|nr:hypothetical protein [Phycisphaerae bacterium]